MSASCQKTCLLLYGAGSHPTRSPNFYFFIEAKPNLKFRQQLNELHDFCMRWYTWKLTTYIVMVLLIVFSFKCDLFDQC